MLFKQEVIKENMWILFVDKRDKVTVCLDLSELNTYLLW